MRRIDPEHVLNNVSPSWPGSMGVNHASTVSRRSQRISGVVRKSWSVQRACAVRGLVMQKVVRDGKREKALSLCPEVLYPKRSLN